MTDITIADMTMQMVTAMAPAFRSKTFPAEAAAADIIVVIEKVPRPGLGRGILWGIMF